MASTTSQKGSNSLPHASTPPAQMICLYAQEDEQYFRKLQTHLHMWVRHQKVTWLEISAGERMNEAMTSHLQRADLVLLLLSPDFLATDFSYEAMLSALTERSQRQIPVVPILARISAWKESECGDLSALPEGEIPIATWLQQDAAYESIRQGLLLALPELKVARPLQSHRPMPVPSPSASAPSKAVSFVLRDLPGEYVARPQVIRAIKQQLLGQQGIQTTAITTALRGSGGFGKTTLALALCHDPEVQAAFPDGILWIELGEDPPRTLELLNGLLAALGTTNLAVTLEEAQKRWSDALADKTCLLVIDDVWQMEALKPLLEGGPRCKRLVTTRNDRVLPDEAARVIVDAMATDEALALLCQGLPADIQQPSAQTALAHLVKQLGYWPLLLSVARGLLATHLRYGRPLTQALAMVEQVYASRQAVSVVQGQTSGFQESMDTSLQASLRQLQTVVSPRYHPAERYQELAIFPEDTAIPLAELRLFWHERAGLQPWEVDDLCMQLHGLSLVQDLDLTEGTLRLHDVVRSFLVQRAGPALPALHTHFLDAVRRGMKLSRWAELPESSQYLWQHLIWHLCQAQRWEELEATLTDLNFLAHKAVFQGVASLEADLQLATISLPDPTTTFLVPVHRTIVRISHLLRQVHTLAEMGGLLLSHLGWDSVFAVERLALENEIPRPFLTAWHPFPDQTSSALLRILRGHTRWVKGCAFSPDGHFIVSASDDNTLKVWNAATGAERLTLRGHTASVNGCAVSPDSRFIISASDDRTLKVWDAATGTERFTLRGHAALVNGCAVSPDGRFIVSASYDATLKVWDATTGTERFTLSHTDKVEDCTVSPDSRFIISASDDRTLKVWDSATGAARLTLKGHTDSVRGCAVSPDGRFIISASDDHTLKIWDAARGTERLTLKGHTASVRGCAVSPDGRFIVSASWDDTLKVWDAATGAERFTLKGHTHRVNDCAISPDGRFIVSASYDNTLKVWDAATGGEQLTPRGHARLVNDCAISPDGRFVVSASDDNTLKVWNTATGEEQLTLSGHTAGVEGCAVSPDARFIVSASDDQTLKVWNAITGTARLTLKGHTDSVRGCAISPDGRFVVSASDDTTLKVWDAATGTARLTLKGHKTEVHGCAISPDGHFIVSASDDYPLKVWDAVTGAERLTLKGHTFWVEGCAFSPDGRFIVSASDDDTLKVWNATTGAERLTLSGHTDSVNRCAVSPDGRFIVSVSNDQTLKVWEYQTGRCILTFPVDGELHGCAMSLDGEHLVVCGNQGILFLRLVI